MQVESWSIAWSLPVWRSLQNPATINVVSLAIETEREADGRWIAEIPDLPGDIAYGDSRDAALRAAQSLALRVVADRLENGEPVPQAVLQAFSPAA